MALQQSAGRYRYRVQIQTSAVGAAAGRDASGAPKRTWADAGAMWAAVQQYSGEERKATSAGGTQALARVEVRTRWRADIQPGTHRLIHQSRAYNIRSLAGGEVGGELIIICDTGAPHA